ncbi:MAG: hypothetical protein Q4E17_05920 [Synergistes sp.]|nr:hypothetical protein [Synergistes sp.]
MSGKSLNEAKEDLRVSARKLSITKAIIKNPLSSVAAAATAGAATAVFGGAKFSVFRTIKSALMISSRAIYLKNHFIDKISDGRKMK